MQIACPSPRAPPAQVSAVSTCSSPPPTHCLFSRTCDWPSFPSISSSWSSWASSPIQTREAPCPRKSHQPSRPFIKALSKRASTGRCMLLIAPARASSASAGNVAARAACGAGDRSGRLSKRQSGCHIAGARRHHCHCFICICIRAERHRRHYCPVVTFDPPPCACSDSVLN